MKKSKLFVCIISFFYLTSAYAVSNETLIEPFSTEKKEIENVVVYKDSYLDTNTFIPTLKKPLLPEYKNTNLNSQVGSLSTSFKIIPILKFVDNVKFYSLYINVKYIGKIGDITSLVFKLKNKKIFIDVSKLECLEAKLINLNEDMSNFFTPSDKYFIYKIDADFFEYLYSEFKDQTGSVAVYTNGNSSEIKLLDNVFYGFVNLDTFIKKYLNNVESPYVTRDSIINIPYAYKNLVKVVVNSKSESTFVNEIVKNLDGNLILNPSFSITESLKDDYAWEFSVGDYAVANAEISDGEIVIKQIKGSEYPFSIQVFQNGILIEKGKTYILTFEAYADKNRKIQFSLDNQIKGYVFKQYSQKLTQTKTKYTVEFTPTFKESLLRIAFGMASNESSAAIHIDNVSIKEKQ